MSSRIRYYPKHGFKTELNVLVSCRRTSMDKVPKEKGGTEKGERAGKKKKGKKREKPN